jgi:hypothetical protein
MSGGADFDSMFGGSGDDFLVGFDGVVNNDLLDGHDGTLDTCVSDPDPESNCET